MLGLRGMTIAGKVGYGASCLLAAVLLVVSGYAHKVNGLVTGLASSNAISGGARGRPASRRPPPWALVGRYRLAWGRVGAPTQVEWSLLERVIHRFLSFPQAGASACASAPLRSAVRTI